MLKTEKKEAYTKSYNFVDFVKFDHLIDNITYNTVYPN